MYTLPQARRGEPERDTHGGSKQARDEQACAAIKPPTEQTCEDGGDNNSDAAKLHNDQKISKKKSGNYNKPQSRRPMFPDGFVGSIAEGAESADYSDGALKNIIMRGNAIAVPAAPRQSRGQRQDVRCD